MTMMEQDKPLVRTRRRFTKEFKADATALVLDGEQSIARVARDLGTGRVVRVVQSTTGRTAPGSAGGVTAMVGWFGLFSQQPTTRVPGSAGGVMGSVGLFGQLPTTRVPGSAGGVTAMVGWFGVFQSTTHDSGSWIGWWCDGDGWVVRVVRSTTRDSGR